MIRLARTPQLRCALLAVPCWLITYHALAAQSSTTTEKEGLSKNTRTNWVHAAASTGILSRIIDDHRRWAYYVKSAQSPVRVRAVTNIAMGSTPQRLLYELENNSDQEILVVSAVQDAWIGVDGRLSVLMAIGPFAAEPVGLTFRQPALEKVVRHSRRVLSADLRPFLDHARLSSSPRIQDVQLILGWGLTPAPQERSRLAGGKRFLEWQNLEKIAVSLRRWGTFR